MKKLPIVRLFVYIFIMTAVMTGLGYAVCLQTGNITAMTAVMLLSLAIGMTLILRWWIPVNRAMGVSTPKPTTAQWLIIVSLIASLNAIVVVDHFVFQLTHNRWAEAATAVCAFLPVGFFVLPQAWRNARPLTANEFQLSRLNYFIQLVMPIIFGLNLCLQLWQRHPDPSLSGFRDWIIAGYFAFMGMFPFAIAQTRRRYLEAKSLSKNSPPDRWQAYKNKLAAND